MRSEDEKIYDNSDICYICKEKLDTYKIRDYSTITGKFRGASQSKCSIKLNISNKLPITFHNLKVFS